MDFFRKKIITPFAALAIALAVGLGTWGVTALVSGGQTAPVQEDAVGEQYNNAVADAMLAGAGEIEPLVCLTKEDPMVTWDENGERVLLLSWHKYPDSYAEGSDITLDYGPVWTFTDKEIVRWYQENKSGVSDWDMRLRQLIGLAPDSMYTHMTAFWANPQDVVRPAYCRDVTSSDMAVDFAEVPDDVFLNWFNGNIISSYYDGAYPWTRLGYTYDWAKTGNNGRYGLTEFLVEEGAPVTVEFTKTTADFLAWMEAEG